MIFYFRLLLLFCTFAGYSVFLSKRLNIKYEFTPALISSGISSIMFIAGILNIFIPVVYILTLTGVVFLVIEIIYNRGKIINGREWTIIILSIIVIAYFAVLLRGSHFLHYDNFSHWVTVITDMLKNDRMPNFQDSLIMFQSYPLGSSLFIYYVCKVIGQTDACYIFAQFLMTFSFILPLTAFVSSKKKNYVAGASIIVFALYAFTCNIAIYDLLVDTLMPLGGVALICIIVYEFRESEKPRIVKLIWEMLPLNIFLIHVKNSGIFFCLVGWIYFVVELRRKKLHFKKNLIRFIGIDILVALFTSYLWKQHVQLVFASGETSKHAMSITNYKSLLGEKTKDDIISIGSQIIDHLKDTSNVTFMLMAAITSLMFALIIAAIVQKQKSQIIVIIKETLVLYVIFFVYVLSVFGMYIFSMPLGEAIVLASYDRYMLTIDIFLLGMAVIYFLQAKVVQKKMVVPIVSVFILITTLYPAHDTRFDTLIKKQDYESTSRYKLQKIINDNNIAEGANYLVYSTETDFGYLLFLSRYELWSTGVTLAAQDNLEECIQNYGNYNYIIIFTPDDYSNQVLAVLGLDEFVSQDGYVIDTTKINVQ